MDNKEGFKFTTSPSIMTDFTSMKYSTEGTPLTDTPPVETGFTINGNANCVLERPIIPELPLESAKGLIVLKAQVLFEQPGLKGPLQPEHPEDWGHFCESQGRGWMKDGFEADRQEAEKRAIERRKKTGRTEEGIVLIFILS
ncbi:hypothetical protein G2W53_005723 [Senna tora]|uniref:Uncharacterized protein n=1 Tax=Senna tora TaxID=362788 RepID=A0A835CD40_9FABA|nr:hypothetical protein G2W53_005723 [Senna tora]